MIAARVVGFMDLMFIASWGVLVLGLFGLVVYLSSRNEKKRDG